MSSSTPMQAHRNHVQWQNETATWRDDIKAWRNEHRTSLKALNQAMSAYDSALTTHLESLARHERNLADAERILAERERDLKPAMGAIDRDVYLQIEEKAAQQAQLRDDHECIKRHHYMTVARLGVLVETLGGKNS